MSLTIDTKIQKQTFSNQSYNDSGVCIRGVAKDIEALEQSIRKRLSTQQFEYPIYSFNYGVDWRDLIGQDQEYIRAEMQRMIRETLQQDDFSGRRCVCSFEVSSIFGQLREGVEVDV